MHLPMYFSEAFIGGRSEGMIHGTKSTESGHARLLRGIQKLLLPSDSVPTRAVVAARDVGTGRGSRMHKSPSNGRTEKLIDRPFKVPLKSNVQLGRLTVLLIGRAEVFKPLWLGFGRLRASHGWFNSLTAVKAKEYLLVQGVQTADVKLAYMNASDESSRPLNSSPAISQYLLRTVLQSPLSTQFILPNQHNDF
jgi:hypothetical protein